MFKGLISTRFCQQYSSLYFYKSDGHKVISILIFLYLAFCILISLSISLYAGLWYVDFGTKECSAKNMSGSRDPAHGLHALAWDYSHLEEGLILVNPPQSNIWASTGLDHLLISHLGSKFWEFFAHIFSPHLTWRSCLFLSFLAYYNPCGDSDVAHFFSNSVNCRICAWCSSFNRTC